MAGRRAHVVKQVRNGSGLQEESREMTCDEVLRRLGVQKASEVTIENLPAPAGSNRDALQGEFERHAAAQRRGDCVARGNGRSEIVSKSLADQLVKAGAKDMR